MNTWLDQAERLAEPWEEYDNGYTRLCKLIYDLEKNDAQ